jgi:hypothetical protein
MKQLKKDLQAISNILKQLTKKTETIAKNLGKLEKAKPAKRAKAKAVRKVKAKTTRKAKPKAVRKIKAKATREAKPKVRAKVVKKATKISASGTVLTLVRRSRKGIDVAMLREKSGLEGRKINDIVHRLKREGKIKATGRGIYVKA